MSLVLATLALALAGPPAADACPGPGPDAKELKAFSRTLTRGQAEAEAWAQCAAELRPTLDEGGRADLDAAVAEGFAARAREGDAEGAAALLGLREATEGVRSDKRLDKVEARLRKGGLPEATAPLATEWLDLLDMGRGLYRGRTVDQAFLDEVEDESLLEKLWIRLPDGTTRQASRVRLVHLRVQASSFSELHGDEAVVARVVELGHNPVHLAEHPLREARWSDAALPLWVVQDLERQRVRLLVGPEDAPVDTQDLRPLLEVDLEGVSRPVTACGPPEDLDVSPCLDLATDSPWGRVEHGHLHLAADAPLAEAATLGRTLAFPVTEGGVPAADPLELPVRFALPEPLVLGGGAELEVELREAHDRTLWSVWSAADPYTTWLAVAERDEARRLVIGGAGVPGAAGAPGKAGEMGEQGLPGTRALCPGTPARNGGRGGDGGPGARGGDGGPGGPGGKVVVTVIAPDAACAALKTLAYAVVSSRGGPGGAAGPGGVGGPGGLGGEGGDATTCYEGTNPRHLARGMPGSRGRDGARGADGSPGLPGPPGEVVVACEAP